MDLVALELVDCGLRFLSPRGRLSPPSPGLALIDGRELAVGSDAENLARLKPRRLHTRFWQDLGTAPLARPFPAHLRTADLAHAHLKAVWETAGFHADRVVVAVPGVYEDDQLALFLGITQELHIPVRGLVDLAVAAAADRELQQHVVHLDLHFHRSVLTTLEHGRELARTAVRVEPRVGLLGLRDLWAREIAQIFVRSTRFDPLHQAVTEQVLYAQLSDHLAVLTERKSTRVRFTSGGRHHAVDIDRERIVDAAETAYSCLGSLVQQNMPSQATTVLLSPRAAALPGFVDHLGEHAGVKAVVLHPTAAMSGALTHADRLQSPDLGTSFVTRLPSLDARPPGPVTVPVTPPREDGRRLPTHLVVGGVAHRIGTDPLVLGPSGVNDGTNLDHGSASVRRLAGQVVVEAGAEVDVNLNGNPIEGRKALAPGDRIRVGEATSDVLVVSMAD